MIYKKKLQIKKIKLKLKNFFLFTGEKKLNEIDNNTKYDKI